MLILVEWLHEYLSGQLSVTQIETALGAAGIEVEATRRPPEFDESITAATVEEVKPHPNADKLRVATVSTGGDERVEVVCGAPNLYEGQRAVLARVGATLPGGTTIENTTIRGQGSHGMLCSEYELQLGSDQSGIIDLGPETEAGTPLTSLFNENYTVIEVDTPTNRWDSQGYIGLAREVAAHTETDVVFDGDQGEPLSGQPRDDLFENHAQEDVFSYGLARLEADKDSNQESPAWMQRRLRFHGIKPMNAIVDITNYAMLVTGQPLHAFDSDRAEGKIHVRYAHNGETITTLDDVERCLNSSDLVIADESGPLALAGVMGGRRGEISSSSRKITLEAASFSGSLVRTSAKRHGLRTEASSRFERGIPMQAATRTLQYAAELLRQYAGAEVTAHQTERSKWPWVQRVGVPASRAAVLSGIDDLSRETIAAELQKLHFEARPFDIAAEARAHLGKPYKWGARFKTDGTDAFDCSYLVDYLYSLIGVTVGHTALGQYEHGTPVEVDDLQPGDVVFYEGKIEHSATDHYYTLNGDGSHTRHELAEEKRVGHNGVYIGDGTVVMAAEYKLENGQWVAREEPGVVEVELSEFTLDGGYLGARRYVTDPNEYVTVTVPWWRPDVTMLEDVVEEVVKLIGLDEIPVTLPGWQPTDISPDEYWYRLNELRWLLYGLGLFEVTTYPFISEEDITTFHLEKEHLKLANPRSQEQAYLRTTLLPLLVRSVTSNTGYARQFGVFEMARVFFPHTEEPLPSEQLKLGIAMKAEDVIVLKGYIDQVLEHIHADPDIDNGTDTAFLHPTRQARIYLGEEMAAWFGEVHPDILAGLKHRESVSYAEIDIAVLLRHYQPSRFVPLPRYPSSYRDITVLLPMRSRWQDLRRSLERMDDVVATFVDEYYKENDQKAVTIHLELQAREETLTDARIQHRLDQIKDVLEREHGAQPDS